MNRFQRPSLPFSVRWFWLLAALVGLAGLAIRYGQFHRIEGLPEVSAEAVRWIFLASLALFVLSRLLLLIPPRLAGERLRRWWLDYVLLGAGLIAWVIDPEHEAALLDVAVLYMVGLGLWVACGALIDRVSLYEYPIGAARLGRRLAIAGLLAILVGGTLLALPLCWEGPYPARWDETYPGQSRYELSSHWLDCTFTAAAALTGTGLAVREIGYEFSPIGHVLIIVLMEIGLLAMLIVGTTVGWRLRYLAGGCRPEDDIAPRTLRRVIYSVLIIAIVLQLVGIAGMRPLANEAADPDAVLAQNPWLASTFHAVSAFGNVGLTLTRNSFIDYRGHTAVYAVLGPLMLLGSIGGPVIYELLRRIVNRGRAGRLSRYTRRVVPVTLLIILLGAGLLNWFETTPDMQLRYPRDRIPGRLILSEAPEHPAEQSPDELQDDEQPVRQANDQRLAGLDRSPRWMASVFQSVAARTGGFQTVRLDEDSISPASGLLLMGLMLIGGDLGGTAGGMRLLVLMLVGSSLCFSSVVSPAQHRSVNGGARWQVLAIAMAAVAALVIISAVTALLLVYREAGTPFACLFEAVSASCNVGFSMGLTPRLSVQGCIVVILAMWAGRVIPLAILLRCVHVREVPCTPVVVTPTAAGPYNEPTPAGVPHPQSPPPCDPPAKEPVPPDSMPEELPPLPLDEP